MVESVPGLVKMTAPALKHYLTSRYEEFALSEKAEKELFDKIEAIVKELPECDSYDHLRAMWIKVPRGTIEDFDDYEYYEEEGIPYEEFEEIWESYYPDEYNWYVVRCADAGQYGRWISIDQTAFTPDRDDDYPHAWCHIPLLEWLVTAVRQRVDEIKAGTYERDVLENLPLKYRRGIMRRTDLWESGYITKERDMDGLTAEQISKFEEMVNAGIEDVPVERIPEMTVNEYLEMCKFCYRARGDGSGESDLFRQRHHFECWALNPLEEKDHDDPDAYYKWLTGNCDGHAWEIRGGHSFSRMSLHTCFDGGGYYYILNGSWDRGDFVRIAIALYEEGVPVCVDEAKKVLRMLKGEDWVGVTTFKEWPAYCNGNYSDYDVLDCIGYSEELIDAASEKIEWFPVKTFYPLKNARNE